MKELVEDKRWRMDEWLLSCLPFVPEVEEGENILVRVDLMRLYCPLPVYLISMCRFPPKLGSESSLQNHLRLFSSTYKCHVCFSYQVPNLKANAPPQKPRPKTQKVQLPVFLCHAPKRHSRWTDHCYRSAYSLVAALFSARINPVHFPFLEN